jgi:micrococcal nuclease
MIKIMFIVLLLTSAQVMAKKPPKTYGTLICSEVTSVYDGDTFRCTIPTLHPLIGERIGIRVGGVDTPEMRDKRPKIKALARKAKQHTVEFLRSGKKIELRNVKRGKYFRIVADVYVDGKSLTSSLVNHGLGMRYDGGTKVKW